MKIMNRCMCLLTLGLVALFSACTQSPIDDSYNGAGGLEFKASIGAESTKTSISGTKFSWVAGDQVGVYISQAEDCNNVSFSASDLSNENKSAIFRSSDNVVLDKVGTDNSVVAYYPYDADAANPIKFTLPAFQSQTSQTPDHLGEYNYMATAATKWSKVLPTLSFKQLMAKVDFTITNKLSSEVKIEKISIKPHSGKFYTDAVFDIASSSATPSLSTTDSQTAAEVGVNTSGDWTTVATDKSVTASMMLVPADMSSDMIDVTIVTNDGTYVCTKPGINFTKRHNYSVGIALSEKSLETNVSTLDFATTGTSLSFDLKSINGATDGVTITTEAKWLTLSAASVDVPEYDSADSSTVKSITVTATRDGMEAGSYTSEIVVKSSLGEIKIPVTITVPESVKLDATVESCDDDFEFTILSCEEAADGVKVAFSVKNVGTATKKLSIYDNSSYVFDDLGSRYAVDDVSLGGSNPSYNASVDIPAAVIINGYITVDGVNTKSSILKYISVTTNYDANLVIKNAAIKDRVVTALPAATTTGTIFSCSDNIEFTLLGCKESALGLKVNFRLKNTGSALMNFNNYTNGAYAYDDRGTRYELEDVSLGDQNHSYTSGLMLPPNVDVNGYFIIDGISSLASVLKYVSLSTNQDAAVVMKNVKIEGATASALPEATTTGTILSCSDNIEFTLLGCKSSASGLKVSYRLKNTDSALMSFNNYTNGAYAYDDRGTRYELEDVSLGDQNHSYTSGLMLPPNVDVNGYFIIEGMASNASVLKYVSLSTNLDAAVVMKDVKIEGATASALPEATTTGTLISCSDNIEYTLLGCRSSASGLKVNFRLKNTGSALMSFNNYTNGAYAYDDRGTRYALEDVSLGDQYPSYTSGLMLPPNVDVNGYFIIEGMASDAALLKYVSLNTNLDADVVLKDVKIEGATATALPEATTKGIVVSFSDDVDVTLLGCKPSALSRTKVTYRFKNKSTSPILINIFANDSTASDDKGSSCDVEYISVGDKTQSRTDGLVLPPNVEVNGYVLIEGVSAEATKLTSLTIDTNFDNAIRMTDVVIEK